jgi:hypothetical protein
MTSSRPVLLTLTAAAVLFATAGCGTPGTLAAAHRGARVAGTTGSSAAPAAATPKTELIAALQRSQRAPHKYTVNADLPDKQRVQATGAFDLKGKKIKYARKEIGGKYPTSLQLTVVGKDEYTRESAGDTWVHLDLRRVKKGGIHEFDLTDPTGLIHFTTTIKSVQRVDAHTYRGTYDPFEGTGEFLPIGIPSLTMLGWGGEDPFTVRTDARGWVTSIDLVLTVKKETMRMRTTMSDHGKSTSITKPKHSGEAMDFYYKN